MGDQYELDIYMLEPGEGNMDIGEFHEDEAVEELEELDFSE